MPLIKVQTSIFLEKSEFERMLKNLSPRLAKHTGKPESYVMTAAKGYIWGWNGSTFG